MQMVAFAIITGRVTICFMLQMVYSTNNKIKWALFKETKNYQYL